MARHNEDIQQVMEMQSQKKSVNIGGLEIGKGSPIRIESMLKTPVTDIDGCRQELKTLKLEGCELVRVAFPEMSCLQSLKALLEISEIPIMADIHFDAKLAKAALEAGCMAIRINPGNMPKGGLADVVRLAKEKKAVIRIGSNSGSLNNVQLEQAMGNKAKALFIAVQEQVKILEDMGFDDIILSSKSTSIAETINANLLISRHFPQYPVHIGMTEAGAIPEGLIKSAAGISLLLMQGIGDTLRISLSAPASEEVRAGYALLRSLGLRKRGVEVISCPACGRRRLDVSKLVEEIRPALKDLPDGTVVAIMGCEVNGPREAMDADIGVAGTPNGVVIFKKGEVVGHLGEEEMEKIGSLFKDML